MSLDGISRLEQAKEALESGRPARGLALLKAPLPAPFLAERDFLTAECLRAQGFFDRAAALYRKVLARSGGVERDLRTESCLALASVHRSLGQVAEARRRLAEGRRQAQGGYAGQFDLEDALIDRAQGLYARSLAKLKPILSGFEREGDWAAAAFILWAAGGARRFSGDLRGGERDFLKSLSYARRAGDPSGEAYALFGLGGVTRIQGRLEVSRRYYAQAGARLASTDDVFGKAYARCGLANALRQMGRFREAETNYRVSHKLYSSLGDRVDLAYVDWGLGMIALNQGKLAAAEREIKKALSGFSSGNEERGIALSQGSLARVWHAQGFTSKAEAMFERAVRGARKAGLHTHLESFT